MGHLEVELMVQAKQVGMVADNTVEAVDSMVEAADSRVPVERSKVAAEDNRMAELGTAADMTVADVDWDN